MKILKRILKINLNTKLKWVISCRVIKKLVEKNSSKTSKKSKTWIVKEDL